MKSQLAACEKEDYILALPLFPLEKVWREVMIMLLYYGPKAGLGGGVEPSFLRVRQNKKKLLLNLQHFRQHSTPLKGLSHNFHF